MGRVPVLGTRIGIGIGIVPSLMYILYIYKMFQEKLEMSTMTISTMHIINTYSYHIHECNLQLKYSFNTASFAFHTIKINSSFTIKLYCEVNQF